MLDKTTAIEPTLESIRFEQEDAAAERAEKARLVEKRGLLTQVLSMQKAIDVRYDAVKAQKKLLKGLRADLVAIDNEDDLTAQDLKELLVRAHEAYDVSSIDRVYQGGIHAAGAIAGEPTRYLYKR